jgi:hypothetical protein
MHAATMPAKIARFMSISPLLFMGELPLKN